MVECGLKACIAKNTKRYDFPEKKTVNDSYTHNLEQLIGVAGLRTDLETEIHANGDFASNWALVKDWGEDSRYEKHDFKKVVETEWQWQGYLLYSCLIYFL